MSDPVIERLEAWQKRMDQTNLRRCEWKVAGENKFCARPATCLSTSRGLLLCETHAAEFQQNHSLAGQPEQKGALR